MRIWTKSVFIYDEDQGKYILDENASHFKLYEGQVTLCKGESGGGDTTTVQKSEPWEGQKDDLEFGFQQARNQFNSSGPQYYQGETVVPFSPETNAALALQTERAITGSPIQGAANSQLTNTLNGDYLAGGQGFNAAFDAAARKIMPMVDSGFNQGGRLNSGLAEVAKTQALGDAFAGLYGNERENMMRATFSAPQIAQQDYIDFSKLAEVGAQRENLSQEELQSDINKWNYEEQLPANKLQTYMNMINGNYGQNAYSTSSGAGSSRNPLMSGVGGLLSAQMLGISPAAGLAMGLLDW